MLRLWYLKSLEGRALHGRQFFLSELQHLLLERILWLELNLNIHIFLPSFHFLSKHCKCQNCVHQPDSNADDEHEKPDQVASSHTFRDPRTMMIVPFNTNPTALTMHSFEISLDHADFTIITKSTEWMPTYDKDSAYIGGRWLNYSNNSAGRPGSLRAVTRYTDSTNKERMSPIQKKRGRLGVKAK